MDRDGAQVICAALREDAPVTRSTWLPPALPPPLEALSGSVDDVHRDLPERGPAPPFGVHQCSRERVFTDEERRLFQEIGRRLAGGLTSLFVVRRLKESQRKLGQAQELAQVGHWEFDLQTNRAELSDTTYRILGTFDRASDRGRRRVHPPLGSGDPPR